MTAGGLPNRAKRALGVTRGSLLNRASSGFPTASQNHLDSDPYRESVSRPLVPDGTRKATMSRQLTVRGYLAAFHHRRTVEQPCETIRKSDASLDQVARTCQAIFLSDVEFMAW